MRNLIGKAIGVLIAGISVGIAMGLAKSMETDAHAAMAAASSKIYILPTSS